MSEAVNEAFGMHVDMDDSKGTAGHKIINEENHIHRM
jgi:hypothetical protein